MTTTSADTESTGTSTTGGPACLTWEIVEGGVELEQINHVAHRVEGGFALAGRTKSKGAGHDDFWLLHLDEEGEILADFTYGSAAQEIARTVAIAPDQSALLAGIVAVQQKTVDGLMIGVSSEGAKLWELQVGGNADDHLMAAVPVSGGGFAVAGTRDRTTIDTGEFWLVRVSDSGEVLWTQTYGDDSKEQLAYALVETKDGGFALGGTNDGDFWLVRTDADGKELWAKTYGGDKYERAVGLDLFDDDGFALGGWVDADGASDFYLVRTDAGGEAVWEVTLDEDYDLAEGIEVVDDGGVVLVGHTGPEGLARDLWAVKVDALGDVVWDRRYGGDKHDTGRSVIETASGDLVFAGYTDSKGAGSSDGWVLRTNPEGELTCR